MNVSPLSRSIAVTRASNTSIDVARRDAAECSVAPLESRYRNETRVIGRCQRGAWATLTREPTLSRGVGIRNSYSSKKPRRCQPRNQGCAISKPVVSVEGANRSEGEPFGATFFSTLTGNGRARLRGADPWERGNRWGVRGRRYF